MAKKTTTLRVHTLAKELGVSSKDIIAKCKAEDIPDITNHMSAVSVGLSHTIREWFGDAVADGSTAVETAAPVDVAAVRKKAKKVVRKVSKKASSADEGDGGVATLEGDPSTEAAPVAKKKVTKKKVVKKVAAAIDAEAAAVPPTKATSVDSDGDLADGVDSSPEAADDASGSSAEPARMNVPDRPKSVTPVGPKLEAPKKVALSGPKVIRVEEPEPERAPKPRNNPPASGMMSNAGPRRGGGAGGMEADQNFGRGGGPSGRRSGSGNKTRSPRRNEGRSGRAG
ncbi:MAG: translation initiation factor IF-2 N-terminal domain-containing protein, partial [Planctomycetota bacterium]|nr:translation initiation factor IF-2 N-terminal domain-containing protein [Planctomycetota bacterium]